MPAGYSEFEFDLPGALRAELIRLFSGMEAGLLQLAIVNDIADAQGVYQLFYGDTLVYIGKTDAEAGLRTRLVRHAKKILHRPTLADAVRFKAVRIMVFTALDLETQLIKHYRGSIAGGVSWNGSGFGSNDPGRERETTNKKPDGFDTQHPIDIDLQGELVSPGEMTVAAAVSRLKSILPYTFRYETLRDARGRALRHAPHAEMEATSVLIPPAPQTTRGLLRVIREALGPNWQATAFASHVILYKEGRDYRYGSVL